MTGSAIVQNRADGDYSDWHAYSAKRLLRLRLAGMGRPLPTLVVTDRLCTTVQVCYMAPTSKMH